LKDYLAPVWYQGFSHPCAKQSSIMMPLLCSRRVALRGCTKENVTTYQQSARRKPAIKMPAPD
jgi:hypothetical protein